MSDEKNPLDNPETVRELKSFQFKRVDDLELIKPEYLIDRTIEKGSTCVVFGAPKSAKSLLVQDMGFSLSTTDDTTTDLDTEWDLGHWHGLKTPTHASPVLYICGEGWNGIKRREMAWRKGRPARGDSMFYVSQTAANLTSTDATLEVIEGAQAALGDQTPAMVIVDTLARNFGGQDENTSQAIGAFINNLDLIRAAFKGAAVVVVHHTGHGNSDRPRGSSAIIGAVDTAIKVEKMGQVVTMSVVAQKDCETIPPMHFTIKPETIATDDQGLAVTSVRLVKDEGHTVTPVGMGDNQFAVWNAIRDTIRRKQSDGLPQFVSKDELKRAVSELDWRKIRDALRGLENRGSIKMEGDHVTIT